MLSPLDLQNKKVVTKKRKYDKIEMDEYLDLVFENYKELFNENQELQKKVKTLSDGIQYYRSIESTLQKALVLAEKTSKETKDAAILKAEAIEKDANSRAAKILSEAEQSYEKTKEKCLYLIQQFNKYKVQLKQVAAAQLELVNSESFDVNSPEMEAIQYANNSLPDVPEDGDDTAAPQDTVAEPMDQVKAPSDNQEEKLTMPDDLDFVMDSGSGSDAEISLEAVEGIDGGEDAATLDKTMVIPDLKPELERKEVSEEETLSILTADTIDLRDSIDAVKKEEEKKLQEPVDAKPKEVQEALVIDPVDAKPATPLDAELKEAEIKNSQPEILEPVESEKKAPTLDSLLESMNMSSKKKKKKGQEEEDPFEFLGSVDDF
ncbi:MAG: DivIVA domain-containing protein [Lachnospiraceae bacterium]|nr:DivIVA domain-containing protein [Lachnospiraceae bacterium]